MDKKDNKRDKEETKVSANENGDKSKKMEKFKEFLGLMKTNAMGNMSWDDTIRADVETEPKNKKNKLKRGREEANGEDSTNKK